MRGQLTECLGNPVQRLLRLSHAAPAQAPRLRATPSTFSALPQPNLSFGCTRGVPWAVGPGCPSSPRVQLSPCLESRLSLGLHPRGPSESDSLSSSFPGPGGEAPGARPRSGPHLPLSALLRRERAASGKAGGRKAVARALGPARWVQIPALILL